MAPRKEHKHEYVPFKRINRVVIHKCVCSATKSSMIKKFTKEQAEQVDALIESIQGRAGDN